MGKLFAFFLFAAFQSTVASAGTLAERAQKSPDFQAEELANLIQNSAKTLPEACKVSVAVEDGKLVTTVQNTIDNKIATSHVKSASVDTAGSSNGSLKLWSYKADLVLVFDKDDSLGQIIVWGNGSLVSCPEEKPVDCKSCE